MYSNFFPKNNIMEEKKGSEDMLNAEIVGRVIQEYREKRKLSQEVVSGLADIGRTHLSAIERGVRKPTLETFFRLAEAMDIRPSELMRMVEEMAARVSVTKD